jgi:hypothetical protein
MSEVRLTKARTFELDPAKKYLIQVKEGALAEEDVISLGKQLEKMGIKNAVFVILPKGKNLKIVEQK